MYHYTESGLDNVWLLNGYREVTTHFGKGVAIEQADQLRDQIALAIIDQQRDKLTGKELRFFRTMMGLSQASLGDMLGKTEQSVALWEKTGKVPTAESKLVKALVLESMNGDSPVREVIERINKTERRAAERISMCTNGGGWHNSHDGGCAGSVVA
ncbi:MAG: transcriptional regulator [Gammaproteobacteria bacterium]|nr:transcriptional regulator [Gammaproteobacteria bacterium]